MKLRIFISYTRVLLINSLFFICVTACNNSDKDESELSDNQNDSQGNNKGNGSRMYQDENYENMANFDNADTLLFYDQDPSKSDTTNSGKYEPGPQEQNDSVLSEGNTNPIDIRNNPDYDPEFDNPDDFNQDTVKFPKIDISKQTVVAKELFYQLTNTGDNKAQKKIYREIITKCPDTQEAQLAYYKLANIMMFEESEPNYYGVISLLKDFYVKYPKSQRLVTILPFLLRAYEELNKWDKIAEVYSFVFANSPDVLKKDYIKHSYKFAQALERTNKREEAIKWYKKTLEKDDGKDNNFFINLAKTRLTDLQNNKNN
jgi:tetratricopeptide (TPR) repeat protein